MPAAKEDTPAVVGPAMEAGPINVPARLLMGPGPSNAHPRVLAAQALPLLGHMHPPFLKIMDDCKDGLRYLFQTASPYTCLVSGTGHAGMEATLVNLLEPGDTLLVANSGIWGERVGDMASRYGVVVEHVTAPAVGRAIDPAVLAAAVRSKRPAALFCVQGESSTGVHQSLAGLGDACREVGALLLVDAVASLGGVPFFGDAWGVDAAYAGSQKVLSAPPGAAPLFFGERAMAKLRARTSRPTSFQLDLGPSPPSVGVYWGWYVDEGVPRGYHHTGPVSMWYAMREALAIVCEEGLEALWARHAAAADRLWAGLAALGLEPAAGGGDALVTVNTVAVPPGVDWAAAAGHAMAESAVEIAGGLGPTAGKVWRIGLMGTGAAAGPVDVVVAALARALAAQGWEPAVAWVGAWQGKGAA